MPSISHNTVRLPAPRKSKRGGSASNTARQRHLYHTGIKYRNCTGKDSQTVTIKKRRSKMLRAMSKQTLLDNCQVFCSAALLFHL